MIDNRPWISMRDNPNHPLNEPFLSLWNDGGDKYDYFQFAVTFQDRDLKKRRGPYRCMPEWVNMDCEILCYWLPIVSPTEPEYE